MGLSIRAYARHRGVSHTAVSKAIQAGRITLGADGKINPEVADAQWERNTLPSQNLGNSGGNPSGNLGGNPKKTTAQVSTRAEVAREVATTIEPRTSGPDYQTSRAIREAYAARLAKLEYEERSGQLVSKNEVEVKSFQLARQLRERIQQIPRKVAPQIVAAVVANPDPGEVEELLDEAIREALEQLSQ